MPHNIRLLFLCAGPLLAVVLYLWVPDSVVKPDGSLLELGVAGRVTAGMAGWMVLWWITETIPLYVTALIPMIILPFTGQENFELAAESYGHRMIFLALGGFVLAAALEKWHLHKRFAHFVIGLCGTGPRHIIAGFMIASALLSMWISNVATAIILLPVAISVINLQDKNNPHYSDFSVCLLLGICYSCSVGGMGTLIGTGPNMYFAAYMESELQREIGFASWMKMAVPLVLVMLPLMWLLMTRILFQVPASKEQLKLEFDPEEEAIPWDQGAIFTLVVFAACALSWTFLPLIRQLGALQQLNDTSIALIATLLLFVVPVRNGERMEALMDWDTVIRKVPWGILILLGGGVCLAKAIGSYGLGELLALQLSGIAQFPHIVIILALVAMMVFFTEISSNVASVAAFTPIIASVAVGIGVDPVKLIIPITLAASCAFMLPVATPTNAIIFSSGLIRSSQMARAGLILNLLAIVVITLWVNYF